MLHDQSLGTSSGVAILWVAIVLWAASAVLAQSVFDSGSTGANGPFPPDAVRDGTTSMSLNLNDGVITSQPSDTTMTLPNTPAGGFQEGIFNFTSIDVPPDITVSFIPNAANTPIVWLASGVVTIAGIIRLNGSSATSANSDPGTEPPGGPGGFAGGRGGRRFDFSGSFSGTPGQGPGGGLPGTSEGETGGHGGYGTSRLGALDGLTYGNILLLPLLGGSGGGGRGSFSTSDGSSGGGGGGAILIASSETIAFINGRIEANGGPGSGGGGGGAGGGIRLVANRIEGNGTLLATGGSSGGNGRIRLEAFILLVDAISTGPNPTVGPPLAVGPLTPAELGTIRITDIAGQVVPVPPGGDTSAPDVVFTAAGDITVSLATSGVPLGTTLTVRVATDGQVIEAPSTPTDASGNATASLTVPSGLGIVRAFADFVPTP